MIKAVLFDLDGTLLDTTDDLGAALNHVLIKYGFEPVSKSIYSSAISDGVAALLKVGFKDSLESMDLESLRQEVLNFYESNLAIHTKCFSGVSESLQFMFKQGLSVGIMTNKPTYLTLPLLSQITELSDIDAIVCGDTLTVAKPHPDPLHLTASKLGVASEHCLYVGDAARDVAAAKAAGMKSAVAMWGYIPSPEEALSWEADLYLNSPTDLQSHI